MWFLLDNRLFQLKPIYQPLQRLRLHESTPQASQTSCKPRFPDHVLLVSVEHIKIQQEVIFVQNVDFKKLQKTLLAHRKQIVFVMKGIRLMGISVFNVQLARTKPILVITPVMYVHNMLILLKGVFYSLIVAVTLVMQGQMGKLVLYVQQLLTSQVMYVKIVQAIQTLLWRVMISLIAFAMRVILV